MNALIFVLSVAFGFVLSRSGAADYDFVQGMFLLENPQLYGIIGAGVAVTAPGLLLLKRYGRTATGEPLRIPRKPFHRGIFVGGALFGLGWSITGMCPGPVLVNLGEGKLYALPALAGVVVGTWLLGLSYAKLTSPLKLVPLPDPAAATSVAATSVAATSVAATSDEVSV